MEKFKNYNKCINYLFGLERIGIKYSLKNIRILLKYLGNPEKKLKAIHIAGTNGKGSVASIVNSILIEYGYRCGLYTSPHIQDFRERILINGSFIDKYYIINFINNILDLIEKISPSFFEVITALAFKYFEEEKVDFSIIEVGLGGRLDSTNVLKPIISVITGISIDHTEYLGNTLKKITFEKSGIIKRNTPLILGKMNSQTFSLIENIAVQKRAELIDSTKENKINIKKRSENGFYFDLEIDNFINKGIFLPLIGDFQKWNLATSFSVIKRLLKIYNIQFNRDKIINGLMKIKSNSNFYGRFEKINEQPKIIIDVSHNIEGIRNIKYNLNYFDFNNLYIIFAIMSDKEYKKCIREIEKLNAQIILTKPSYKRALQPEILIKYVRDKSKFNIIPKVENAYELVREKVKDRDLILITGSFYLVSDFLKVLKNKYN